MWRRRSVIQLHFTTPLADPCLGPHNRHSSPSPQLPLQLMADTMKMMSAGHLSRGASHAAQGRSRSLPGAFRQ